MMFARDRPVSSARPRPRPGRWTCCSCSWSASAGRWRCWWRFLLVYFSVRYRRRPGEAGNPAETPSSQALEWFWTLTPLGIFMVIFVWGAEVYFGAYRPPGDAATVYVVGKQWMWKFQHPRGAARDQRAARAGRPADPLLMTSEDVIHSFFVPDFRIHMDVLPGPLHVGLVPGDPAGNVSPVLLAVLRHQPCGHDRDWWSSWSRRTTSAGCTCGPKGRWPWKGARCFSSTAASVATAPTRTPAPRCWRISSASPCVLSDGRVVEADEDYLRESIVDPSAKIVAGCENIMPTFQGPGERRGDLRADRLHPVAEAGRDAAAGRELSAARDHAAHQHRWRTSRHEHR